MKPRPVSNPLPTIDAGDVRRIAALARLRIDEAAIPAHVRHFQNMLGFVGQLQEVDVLGVEPDLHAACSSDAMRSDALREAGSAGGPLPREAVLDNAPDHEGPYFTTPKVL